MDCTPTLTSLTKRAKAQLKATTDNLKLGDTYETSQSTLGLLAHARTLNDLAQRLWHAEQLAADAKNTQLDADYRAQAAKQLSLAQSRLRKAHKDAQAWLESSGQ